MLFIKKKLSIGSKLGLLIIGLIFISFFINYFIQNIIELRLKRENEEKEKWLKLHGDSLIEGFMFPGGDVLEFLYDALATASRIIQIIISTLTQIMTVFIISVIITIFAAVPQMGRGIRNHFECGKSQSDNGFKTGLDTLTVLLRCSWDKFIKFWNGTCTMHYICDMIYGILHGIFVDLPITLIYAIFRVDIKSSVDGIFDIIIEPMDAIIFTISGYHINQWPSSVIENCYRCQGPVQVNGSTKIISKSFGWWGSIFTCTNKEIAEGTDKIFKTIVPSYRWTDWYNGRNLDGSDWS